MALYIFSDAHLGSNDTELEQLKLKRLVKFLDLVKSDGDHLVILGDLFEFWFEYRYVIPKEHHRILFLLDGLRDRGIRIDYVCGNHDFWMGDFFPTQMGIPIHDERFDLEYGGRKIHFIHGDGLAPADRGYRILKRFLRNRMNIWLYRKLPPDWAIPLAKFVAGTSRKRTSTRSHSFAADYRNYALEKLKSGYDIVAIGHLHKPLLERFDNGIYVNSGDFVNHFSYVKIADGKVSLEKISD